MNIYIYTPSDPTRQVQCTDLAQGKRLAETFSRSYREVWVVYDVDCNAVVSTHDGSHLTW